MSGGSFDYLCWKELDSLFESSCVLDEMAEALEALGYADDAAEATRAFQVRLFAVEDELIAIKEPLVLLWKAMEWWKSGDSGEDDVKNELAEYRRIKKEITHGSVTL